MTKTITEIADELNMDPKVARAKLRRMGDEALPPAVPGEGWTYEGKAVDEIKRLLKVDNRRK